MIPKLIVLGSRQQLTKLNSHSIIVGSETIPCASSIKNLGVWFDSCLKFEKHITAKCKAVSHNLHCIGSVRSSLTSAACKVLVHGLYTATSIIATLYFLEFLST